MKKLITLASFIVACSFTTLLAQPPAGGGGGRMDPAQQKEQLKTLGLNDVQADSVMAIQADVRAKFGANMRDMAPEDRMAAMKTMTEARNKRLEAALPADLAKKVEEMYAQRMQRMGQGGGRPAGGNK
jgi:hypothetical protein